MPSAPLERLNAPVTTGWSFTTPDELWDGYKTAVAAGMTASISLVTVSITVKVPQMQTVPPAVEGEAPTEQQVLVDQVQQITTHRLTISAPGAEDVFVYVDNPGNDGTLLTKLVMENGQFKAYTDDEFAALFRVKG